MARGRCRLDDVRLNEPQQVRVLHGRRGAEHLRAAGHSNRCSRPFGCGSARSRRRSAHLGEVLVRPDDALGGSVLQVVLLDVGPLQRGGGKGGREQALRPDGPSSAGRRHLGRARPSVRSGQSARRLSGTLTTPLVMSARDAVAVPPRTLDSAGETATGRVKLSCGAAWMGAERGRDVERQTSIERLGRSGDRSAAWRCASNSLVVLGHDRSRLFEPP
jgi:hypothetical protein